MLPSLSALCLHDDVPATDAKALKGKKANKVNPKPYDKVVIDLKKFDFEKLQPPEFEGKVLKTVKETGRATEAERKWLRETYGNKWSEVGDTTKQEMIQQARKKLSYDFAKLIIQGIYSVRAEATTKFKLDNFREDGVTPKLDWTTEVVPALNLKYPPDWRRDAAGQLLDEAARQQRSDGVKAELRTAKLTKLESQLKSYLEEKSSLVHEQLVEELNFPDNLLKRKARALCRHWFDRTGKDGKFRRWFDDGTSDVTKDLADRRLEWAKGVVAPGMGYDPNNPPMPLIDLILPLDELFVSPGGPKMDLVDGVKAVSDAGGQWLWGYMRALQAKNIEAKDYTASLTNLAFAKQHWDPAFRDKQNAMLVDSYKPFLESVDEMSEIPGAKNVAKSYTATSTPFNRYLLYPVPDGDPTKIPSFGSGGGGATGSTTAQKIGPPRDLHRLYKLISRCPRLPEPIVVLRAVHTRRELPHNLGKPAPVPAVIGRGYLNVTFISTTVANPDNYTGGMLAGFYSKNAADGGCCIYAITCAAGLPVLPLMAKKGSSNFDSEEEVVLPPGLVLVYQGNDRMPIKDKFTGQVKTPIVFFYQVQLPPPVDQS